MKWSAGFIADATGGMLVGDPGILVTAIGTDSRDVAPGSAFVAVAGERFDGNDYAAAALAGGASLVLVDRPDCDLVPRIEVDSGLTALRDLAARRRAELACPVIGITGSTGKTTTKDMLAAALPGAWASPRSYNNEVGVPLTVLDAPAEPAYLVVEVGSRGIGHIEWLAPAVRPTVAVITNIGVVHLETIGSKERVVTAKWELAAALEPGGTLVVPADDPRLHRPVDGTMLTFGEIPAADVRAGSIHYDNAGRPDFLVETPAGRARIRLAVSGKHQVSNAAAAVAAGLAVGVPLDHLAEALETAGASRWRMEIHPGRFTVVNDAYNANPDSMRSALETVAAMPGRHIAVLGRMAELGPVEEEEHLGIGRLARALGFALVVIVGEDPGLAAGAGTIARSVPDTAAAAILLDDFVADDDVILVKASRIVGLETLADTLTEEAEK
jgi:UDP-N-acetylmuramoyl-tripeptide--D-alanyl-D-alanine ligase